MKVRFGCLRAVESPLACVRNTARTQYDSFENALKGRWKRGDWGCIPVDS